MKQEIIDKINRLASQDEPFLFVINYQGDKAFIRLLSDINPEECLFDFEGRGNLSHAWKETWKEGTSEKETWKKETSEEEISETTWQIEPPLYEDYERSFNIVKSNIMAGNSYLTNLTCRVPVSCNLPLEEIFHRAKGKYKLLLRRKRTQAEDKDHLKEEPQNKAHLKEEAQNKAHLKEENIEENLTPFVCFSPETFVRIKGGRIYSYPMKGTLDASLPNAEKQLMEDQKEAAEHATIVDLIRSKPYLHRWQIWPRMTVWANNCRNYLSGCMARLSPISPLRSSKAARHKSGYFVTHITHLAFLSSATCHALAYFRASLLNAVL